MASSLFRTLFIQSTCVRPIWVQSFLVLAILTIPAFGVNAPASADTPTTEKEAPRNGPFVRTNKLLSDLLEDGYEIRATLGTSLVLQKKASVFSCSIVPDQKTLSYQPYFACSELQEIRPTGE